MSLKRSQQLTTIQLELNLWPAKFHILGAGWSIEIRDNSGVAVDFCKAVEAWNRGFETDALVNPAILTDLLAVSDRQTMGSVSAGLAH
jgi:hypothetical protein